MRFYTSPDGVPSVWYDDDDIERIVDGELDRAGLRPTPANPVTDLERFIESHLKVDLDQFADLPADILGVTRFAPRKSPSILINSGLAEAAEAAAAPGTVGRWRATLAHEAAHVFLHKYLFDPEFIQSELPGVTGQLPRSGDVRCLNRDVDIAARPKDWREVQANKGMAALLMPRAVFRRVALRRIDPGSELTVGSPSASALAADLATVFRVSKQAAAIRLQTIGIALPDGVSALPGM